MAPKEPINFMEWRPVAVSPPRGRLFTCGRPGRASGLVKSRVDDDTIDLWVKGLWVKALPPTLVLHIVSLLGKKTTGISEFEYYPFRSARESVKKPTFQEWFDERYGRRFVVHEFPTVDADPDGIPTNALKAVGCHILNLLNCASTVVVVDSAGVVRTKRVCKSIEYE